MDVKKFEVIHTAFVQSDLRIQTIALDIISDDLLALVKSPNNVEDFLVSILPNNGTEAWRMNLTESAPVTVGSDLIHGYITYTNSIRGVWASSLVTRSIEDPELDVRKVFNDMEFISVYGHNVNGSMVAVGRFTKATNQCGLYFVDVLSLTKKPTLINSYPPLTTAKLVPVHSTSYFDETTSLFSLLVPGFNPNSFKVITIHIDTTHSSDSAEIHLNANKVQVFGMHAVYNEREIIPGVIPPPFAPPSEPELPQKDSSLIGMIIGICIGAIALIGIIIGVVLFVRYVESVLKQSYRLTFQ